MAAKMDGLVELPDITGCIGNTDGESVKDYEIPYTSNIEETEYMTIKSIAESSPNINNLRLSHGTGDVHKYLTEMAAFKKKIYIFCTLLLTMLVIVLVTSGVLTYNLVSKSLNKYFHSQRNSSF